VLEVLSGILLCFIVVFTPWAFGATVRWAIWTSCGVSYAMGLILLIKVLYRWKTGFQSDKWESSQANPWPIRVLRILTGLFLAYVLVGCVNYHGVGSYVDGELEFE